MNTCMSNQLNHRLLSAEEEREMVESGDVEGLVKHNLRLVAKIAEKFDTNNKSVDREDVIQYGTLGLIEAAKRFDPGENTRFGTYASYWIRSRISRGYRKDRYNIRPSYGWSNDELDEKKIQYTPLEKKVKHGPDPIRYIDFVEDKQDLYNELELEEFVEALLSLVSERKQKILRLRFGLFDGRDWCLREIGSKIGVSGERIRQLQNQALETIRRHIQSLRDEIKI